MNKKLRTAKINIDIGLNENNVSEIISWTASDYGEKNHNAKSIMLSMWDGAKKETLSIDMWTKDMTVQEMKFFIFQTLLKMNDVIKKSTGEDKLVIEMEKFIKKFGVLSEVIKK